MPNAGYRYRREEENKQRERLDEQVALSSLSGVICGLWVVWLLLALGGRSVLGVEGVESLGSITDTGTGSPTDFVKGEQSVHLHDGEVVTEGNEGWNVNDVLRPLPQVREELHCTGEGKPSHVGQDDFPANEAASVSEQTRIEHRQSFVPDGKMVIAFSCFHAEVGDEDRSDEQGQRVEKFVNLSRDTGLIVKPTARNTFTYHGVRAVRV